MNKFLLLLMLSACGTGVNRESKCINTHAMQNEWEDDSSECGGKAYLDSCKCTILAYSWNG
jgi:hypothetical protein